MMVDESIEVVPSEDNGNIPAEVTDPTPSEPTTTEDAPAKEEPAPPAATEPELFELPDGRKVDAVTLTKEWKENFLPDYTRKSQALAAKETTITKVEKNPVDDPEWQPKSYQELLEIAESRVLTKIEEREKQAFEQKQNLENEVASQLDAVKKLDASVNENALFLHATKYGFRDLRQAYQNMKDMSETVKKVQTKTAADIAKRVDPVSVKPGGSGAKLNPSTFSSGVEYLRALKGQ